MYGNPETMYEEIRNYFYVPDHIMECANACRSDLLHGPMFAIIRPDGIEKFNEADYDFCIDEAEIGKEDKVEPVYTGSVGNALREFIETLHSVFYTEETGEVTETEPEGFEDEETGEYCEPDSFYSVSKSEVVKALFGKTIANEFR